MGRILTPNQEIDFQRVSKRELAHIVNQQSVQLRETEKQRQLLMRILLAIVRDPGIVRPLERNRAVVDRAAAEAVDLDASRLNVRVAGLPHVELEALDEAPLESSAILTPKVLWS